MENETVLKKSYIGNLTGAFADGAVLFPLLAALALQTGLNGAVLLATAGIAYIAAGFIFRVPMAVQPLKSVVVTAIAIGASAAEVRLSGLAVGVVCLGLSFCPLERLAAMVPKHLVHGLQMALGIMLMTKGVQGGFLKVDDIYMKGAFVALAAATILLFLRTQKPVMGWIATAGILLGIFAAFHSAPAAAAQPSDTVHIDIILALVLPQLVLTLANSVIGTHDAAMRYFGEKAKLVTSTRLLRSIGIGNILTAPLGGLPFCHGAGGVTAHVRGGAQNWHMNLMVGGTLLVLAAMSWILSIPMIPAYPKILMNVLLLAVGWFHVGLVKPSWQFSRVRWMLVVMAAAAFYTQDMLWVLSAGIVCEVLQYLWDLRKRSKYDIVQ